MRIYLLFMAAILAACASTPEKGDHHTSPPESRRAAKAPKRMPPDAIARGPMPAPAVRTPSTTYTPPGTGGPTTGQPGYGGQRVRRNSDPRILPPSREATIYASSTDGRKPVVRGIRPKSATDKEAWEECERLVAEAVTDPATFSPELLAKAKGLEDDDWRCAREHALTACYLHLTAPTKDPAGILQSAAAQSDFRDDMARRKEQACRDEKDDRAELIRALVSRGRLFDWKSASDSRNFNENFLPQPAQRPEWMLENRRANEAYREKMRKQAEARKRTITTGRNVARPPDMTGQYMPIPVKAFNACWSITRECLDGFGAGVQSMPDESYECLRWLTVQQCVRTASTSATWINSFREPKPERLVKQRARLEQDYGTDWDDDVGFKILSFGKDFTDLYCPKKMDSTVLRYADRMEHECMGKFDRVFGGLPFLE